MMRFNFIGTTASYQEISWETRPRMMNYFLCIVGVAGHL